MIILGIDPAYSKPIHVARFVDGEFEAIECVPYRYSDQPTMFFDTFKRMFRDALCNITCPECEWKGQQGELGQNYDNAEYCPRCGHDKGLDIKEAGALVAIEKPVFIKVNAQSFIKIHEVYIALKVIAYYEGIRMVEFAPSSWRKVHRFRQGKGVKWGEMKTQAVEKVEELLGKSFMGPMSEQADICESILIAMAAMTPKHKTVTIKE